MDQPPDHARTHARTRIAARNCSLLAFQLVAPPPSAAAAAATAAAAA